MSDLLLRLFENLLRSSGAAVLTAAAICCIQVCAGSKLTGGWRAMLWGLVLARLMLPDLSDSRFSVMNLFGHAEPKTVAEQLPSSQWNVTAGTLPLVASPLRPVFQLPESSRPTPLIRWSVIVAALWLAISIALIVRTFAGNFLFRRRVELSHSAADHRLLAMLDSCRSTLGAPRVRLMETDAIASPSLFGVFRPILLFPPGFSARVSDEELAFVFRHELLHAGRRDLLLDCMARVIACLHWFNPVAWIAARQFRIARELACDQAVLVGRSADERIRYGQTILRLFDELSPVPPRATVAGLIDGPRSISQRIYAIARPAQASLRFTAGVCVCTAIAGCATFTAAKHTPSPSLTAGTRSVQPAGSSTRITTCTYDVRDLLVYVPDWNDPPDLAADASSSTEFKPSPVKPARDDFVNRLLRHIEASIDPASWQINGPGAIRESGGQLVVQQTAANQDAVKALLESMDRGHENQVTVETRFLKIGDASIEAWQKACEGKWVRRDNLDVWTKPLSNADAGQLLAIVDQAKQNAEVTAPRITLFNGQRGYVLVSTQQAYVRDLHLSKTSSQTQPVQTAIVPDIGIAQTGVLLDVQCDVAADSQHLTMTLKPQIIELLSLDSIPWPKAPAGRTDLTVQLPNLRVFSLVTTVTVPNDQYLLFRVISRKFADAATVPPDEIRYMLLHPTLLKQPLTRSSASAQ